MSQLITAFQHEDQVVMAMPYHSHKDFTCIPKCWNVICLHKVDYNTVILLYTSNGRSMSVLQGHVLCFVGYSYIHAQGIIHHNIKPVNFLFDLHRGVGTLVNLGLACVSAPQ
jgi:serine/threonine protein kinase